MPDYNIPSDLDDLVSEIKKANLYFDINDPDQSGDNNFSMNLFVESLNIPQENIVMDEGTLLQIKTNDYLFEIHSSGGGDFHLHNYEINVLEEYVPVLDFDIIEEKKEHEIYSSVQSSHHTKEDFIDGDLGDRIEEYPFYHLKQIDIRDLNANEWLVDEDIVDDYVNDIESKGILNMPPLVISDKGSIIDGIHRLNSLLKVGITNFKCYVGSHDNIEQLKVKEFVKEKNMSKYELVHKKQCEAQKKGLITLFHSGDITLEDELKNGIEPQFGQWLEEVLSGSVDDDDFAEQIRSDNQLAFFDFKPGWVTAKASRSIPNSNMHNITWKDVEKFGQLCVLFVDPDDEMFMQAGIRGAGCVEKSTYLGTDDIADYELPFGVETGDVYTKDAVVPDYTLTGKDLVEFLKKYHPNENIIKEVKKPKLN
jgi:hypothetical protein